MLHNNRVELIIFLETLERISSDDIQEVCVKMIK